MKMGNTWDASQTRMAPDFKGDGKVGGMPIRDILLARHLMQKGLVVNNNDQPLPS